MPIDPFEFGKINRHAVEVMKEMITQCEHRGRRLERAAPRRRDT